MVASDNIDGRYGVSPAAGQVLAMLFFLETRAESWVEGRPAAMTRGHVRSHAKRFGFGAALLPWRGAFGELVRRGLVVEVDGGLSLSPAGQGPAKALHEDFRRRRFDDILIQSEQSSAYLDFLKRTGDLNLRVFSPLSRGQLDPLVDALGRSPVFLDAGCGTGHLTEDIARRTGGTALGIDYAPRAIEVARQRVALQGSELAPATGVRFEMHALETLEPGDLGETGESGFDAVISIDALAFLDDLENAVVRLLACLRGGGELLALTLEVSERPAQAPLAEVLAKLGVPFTQDDLTATAEPVLRARQFASRALRGTLRREGFGLLAAALVEESTRIGPLLEDGRLRRYLYRAGPVNRRRG